ncbi:MAG TPA: site-specific integrase [archaeon]|nr:site-specific integrase [archaeon]
MSVKVRERPTKSGVWWVFIDHQGKRKAKKIGRDKKLAMEVARKIEARLVLGDFNLDERTDHSSKAPLFKEYAQMWLEAYIKGLRRQSTYERYKDILTRHLYPVLGSKPIDQIKRGDIRDVLVKCNREGKSRSIICLIRDVLSGVLGYALDEELIYANPVTGIIKKLKLDRNRKIEVVPLSGDEVVHILETCNKHYPEYYPFLLCVFRTGMRLGELLGLQWSDIDWEGKFIEVKRSYKNRQISPTKTGKTRRVDMSDQLYETLQRLYTQRKKEALASGRGEVEEYIFQIDGHPIAQNSVRYIWKRVLRRARIREVKFHVTRHTFASLLLSNGESPVYVKEQLGHSSIDITVDIYGHLIPSSNREAVNRLDESATFRNLCATTPKLKAANS